MAGLSSDCLAAVLHTCTLNLHNFFPHSHASPCLPISAFLGPVTFCEWDPTSSSSSQSEMNYSQLQSLNLVCSRLPSLLIGILVTEVAGDWEQVTIWSSDKTLLRIMSVSQSCWSQDADIWWQVTSLRSSSCWEGEDDNSWFLGQKPRADKQTLLPRVINISLIRLLQQMPLYLCHDGRFIRCLHYA